MREEREQVKREDETQWRILLRLFFAQIRSKEGTLLLLILSSALSTISFKCLIIDPIAVASIVVRSGSKSDVIQIHLREIRGIRRNNNKSPMIIMW